MSERHACQLTGQHRSTQRRQATIREDEPRLLGAMRRLSRSAPRFGYRRIHRLGLLIEGTQFKDGINQDAQGEDAAA